MQVTARSQLYPGLICWCLKADVPNVFRVGDVVARAGDFWAMRKSTTEAPPRATKASCKGTITSVELNPSVDVCTSGGFYITLDSNKDAYWIEILSLVNSPLSTPAPTVGAVSSLIPGVLPMFTTIVTAFVVIPSTKDAPATKRVLINGEVRVTETALSRNALIIEAGALLDPGAGEKPEHIVIQSFNVTGSSSTL